MGDPKTERQQSETLERLRHEESTLLSSQEGTAGVQLDQLAAIFRLEAIRGFGPQKFRDLYRAGIRPESVVDEPTLMPFRGKTGQAILSRLLDQTLVEITEIRLRAVRQLKTAAKLGARLITYDNPQYPKRLLDSNNAVPVLFARGNTNILNKVRTVACVGSRLIDEPYSTLHRRFAEFATRHKFLVVSGFALGADTIGHTAATEVGGQTICVMPGGLDRPFPPENRPLWNSFLDNSRVCAVSEFQFGRAPGSLTLRKRNKLITALAAGVLVSQSATRGGAMNAYRFAMEQRRPVATFEDDGGEPTSGNHVITTSDYQATSTFRLDDGEAAWGRWLDKLSV